MTNFGDMTQREFSEALASSNPTPGGGSAAAVALSQSAALTIMVADITIGRDKWQNGWVSAELAKKVATPLLEEGFILANKDTDSFLRVMDSFKLPKNNDDEMASRKQAITDATYQASIVPLQTAKVALELLLTLEELATFGNANAVTDVAVASLLASAACKGALFNVEINAISLPTELSADLLSSVDDIRNHARETSRAVMKAVYARLDSN
ncbi:MAG: cyclodeaminase/cyclohydrolase family protein [Candidatus Thalassarchaeaceae archaeon]|jgi:formiminotetrahydrofolate cyclodeaminase|nr:cyclodeaminase/cyclohydrolase family protein [Candidatus Thalassarchaeaceae archaeon]